MKSLLFFLIVSALLLGGGYMAAEKLGVLEGMDISIGKGTIAPINQWRSILPGRWKYYRLYHATNFSWVYEGEVEYTPDGQFTRFLACKYYDGHKGKVDDDYLRVVAGGSYAGTWSIDSSQSVLNEEIKNCNVTVGRRNAGYENWDLDFCKTDFRKGVQWCFGNVVFDQEKFNLMRFDEDKIIIEGQDFTEGAAIKIVFTKLKE